MRKYLKICTAKYMFENVYFKIQVQLVQCSWRTLLHDSAAAKHMTYVYKTGTLCWLYKDQCASSTQAL